MRKCKKISDMLEEAIKKVMAEKEQLFEMCDYHDGNALGDSEIRDTEFYVYSIVEFGESGGINMNILLDGDIGSEALIMRSVYTAKTSVTSKEAYLKMAELGARIAYECEQWIDAHLDEFFRSGYALLVETVDHKHYRTMCQLEETAMERAKRLMKDRDDYLCVEVKDLYTEEVICKVTR